MCEAKSAVLVSLLTPGASIIFSDLCFGLNGIPMHFCRAAI